MSNLKMKTLFLLLVLTTPGFWHVVVQPRAFISQISQFPSFAIQNISSKIHPNNYNVYIDELRWGGRSLHRNDLFSRALYGHHIYALNEFFEFTQFSSPKLFFLAGDGSNFSPRRIEPISSLLFPFWIIGILSLLRQKNIKLLVIFVLCLTFGYISGHKNLAFLFPLLLTQIYICTTGLSSFSGSKYYKLLLTLILIYGVYITSMNVWLNIYSL